MPLGRWAGAALLFLCLSLAVACAGAAIQADRYFASGDYAQAARAYESSMGGEGQPPPSAKSLYRLGVARSTPGTPAFDPAKALAAFDALASRYPASRYASQAALPAALLRALSASEKDMARLRQDLEAAEAQVAALTKSSQDANQDLQRELEDRRAQVLQLKGKVAELEQSLERLKAQLDQIKRIDLGAPNR